jgi:hypothetical protein
MRLPLPFPYTCGMVPNRNYFTAITVNRYSPHYVRNNLPPLLMGYYDPLYGCLELVVVSFDVGEACITALRLFRHHI